MDKLHDFLLAHASKNPISFHMPGHKGSAIYRRFGYDEFLNNFMDCDVTEIPGADNLFQAEGVLKEVQDRYADLYDVKNSYVQINGTSGGLIGAILASVRPGKKLILARNCHKSVFNALSLGNIQPVYAYPEMMESYGIAGEISVSEIEDKIKNNPDVDAILLPSPNYYGICSDIEAISEVAHKHEKILIVDQAHGAHLKFFRKYGIDKFPKSAEESGADLVVNSIHKTLASYTQSAILNLNSDRVNQSTLEDKLQAIQSTSPSYILMSSLSINADILINHGKELMEEWADLVDFTYDNASSVRDLELFERTPNLDATKINFSFPKLAVPGNYIEDYLMDNNNIFIELYTGNYVMCMTGVGSTKKDMQFLLDGLSGMREGLNGDEFLDKKSKDTVKAFGKAEIFPLPVEKKWHPLSESSGLVCASSLIPYPPGIPLVCPGEKLTPQVIDYIKELREKGEKVIGVNKDYEILVGA